MLRRSTALTGPRWQKFLYGVDGVKEREIAALPDNNKVLLDEILEFAEPRHLGWNVYTNRYDVVAVLRRMERHKFSWWDRSTTEFVDVVEGSGNLHRPPRVEDRHAIIVVEGLDGVGKTTVTQNLADRLGGTCIRTPMPKWDRFRARFRTLPEPLARAFYCGCNYAAADEILRASSYGPVVVDRWYASTAAMAMSNLERCAQEGDAIYRWPSDLTPPMFNLGVLLDVSENIRRKRMDGRGDEDKEEAKLREREKMRTTAMEAYSRMQPTLHKVMVPTYRHAINNIMDLLQNEEVLEEYRRTRGKGDREGAPELKLKEGFPLKKYTAEELKESRPWKGAPDNWETLI